MRAKGLLVKIVFPLLILLAGVLIMKVMILNRPAPRKEARTNPGALVEVLAVASQDRQLTVAGTGTVQAAQEITVVMQVSGRVSKMAPRFVAGGFFSKGELLFAVEDKDYELAVVRAQAAFIKAKNDLQVAESKAGIARREWAALQETVGSEPNPLVLHGPQLENAQANLASAQAVLEQAELDLARTRIVAPFNCRVRSEEIAPGQYVRVGSPVAVLAATDIAEIIVPLPLDDLRWLDLVKPEGAARGSAATVRLVLNGETYEWPGYVDRSLGEIDPASRMARVVVRVAEPYSGAARRLDLEVGMFVEILIQGRTLENVTVLPRKALRENSRVWLAAKNTLQIRPVVPVRIEQDEVLIGKGLADGDLVVVSALSGAMAGMQLRIVSGEESGQ